MASPTEGKLVASDIDHAQKYILRNFHQGDVRITTAMPVPTQQAAFLASPQGLELVRAYTERGRTQEMPGPSQLTHLPMAVASAGTRGLV